MNEFTNGLKGILIWLFWLLIMLYCNLGHPLFGKFFNLVIGDTGDQFNPL